MPSFGQLPSAALQGSLLCRTDTALSTCFRYANMWKTIQTRNGMSTLRTMHFISQYSLAAFPSTARPFRPQHISSVNISASSPCTQYRSVYCLTKGDNSAMQAQFPTRPRSVAKPATKHFSTTEFTTRIPLNSWDSHMHVLTPGYPLVSTAQYQPKPHLLSEALSFEKALGVANIVLVQPSIYGTDNSCLLDALRQLGPKRGRGVVVIDPSQIETTTLDKWHRMGVRGVRVNLVSVGQDLDKAEFERVLRAHAKIIRPYNWVLNLHIPLTAATALAGFVSDLGVTVCLDHFCQPALRTDDQHQYSTTRNPYDLPGFGSLVNLLKQGNTYIKLSAPYRISKEEQETDLDPIGRELLRVADSKCLWASDWPHTRFENVDATGFAKKVITWCHESGGVDTVEKVFRRNAELLWDVK